MQKIAKLLPKKILSRLLSAKEYGCSYGDAYNYNNLDSFFLYNF